MGAELCPYIMSQNYFIHNKFTSFKLRGILKSIGTKAVESWVIILKKLFGLIGKKQYEAIEKDLRLVSKELAALRANTIELEKLKANFQLVSRELSNWKAASQELVSIQYKSDELSKLVIAEQNVLVDLQQSVGRLIEEEHAICEELEVLENRQKELIEEQEASEKIALQITKNNKIIRSLKQSVTQLIVDKNALIEAVKTLSSEYDRLEKREMVETLTQTGSLLDGPPSQRIRAAMEKNKSKQKDLIDYGEVFELEQNWVINDSLSEGVNYQNRQGRFLVTSFNLAVDNIIRNTTALNFVLSAKKIEKWFIRLERNGNDNFIKLNRLLLKLKLAEHRYVFEFKVKQEMEKDEQREIKENIREETKVKKEIEAFIIKREKEEKSFQSKISDAESKILISNDNEINKLKVLINALKVKLQIATLEKERALSMAQLTRSGYVYIISNRGSFGEQIFKIGMTRRLDPMDRVNELGNASVPFFFDVHLIIPSEDAPTLESMLHKKFENKRVNKVNRRREFFKISPIDIEKALNELNVDVGNFIQSSTAEQYENSVQITSVMTEND